MAKEGAEKIIWGMGEIEKLCELPIITRAIKGCKLRWLRLKNRMLTPRAIVFAQRLLQACITGSNKQPCITIEVEMTRA